MKRIILKPGEEQRILAGHPWVYDNEVEKILDGSSGKPANLNPGECADVESVFHGKPRYLGRALVNPHSKIIARLYSPSTEGMDKGFFKRRIREAIKRRLLSGGADEGTYNLGRESARLVFAEADFLPGLIVDRFVGWPLAEIEEDIQERPLDYDEVEARLGSPGSWLSIQFLAYGMDQRRDDILAALEEVLAAPLSPAAGKVLGAPRGIVEKSAAKVRELEGLPLREGLIKGSFPPGGIVIFENGLPFTVSLEDGQKTGHYLDQRDNRLRAAACFAELVSAGPAEDAPAEAIGGPAAAPIRVLDGCSYTGGFAIHILRLGDYGFSAEGAPLAPVQVDCVDASAEALEILAENAALNGVENQVRTIHADIFDFLRSAEQAVEQSRAAERDQRRYDMIILDPPAFAKTRSALTDAIRGYKEINLRAIKLLRAGGILITCSCSQALDESRFQRMIADAACDAERRLYRLDLRTQSADHPVLVGYDESLYLTCGIYRVL
jgi:23S rRNA (cytosine1962-C5)-methyltransferase